MVKQEKGEIMQLKMFLLAGLLVLGVSLSAENLLVNGDFKQQKNSLPAAWSVVGKIDVTSKISGGVTPESGVVCFSVSPGKNNGSLRQNVRQKVQVGKKYRLSVAMKGENFKAADWGFLLINRNWKGNVGMRRFALKDSWRKMSKVVTVPAEWTDVTAVLFAAQLEGKLMVSDVKIEAVK